MLVVVLVTEGMCVKEIMLCTNPLNFIFVGKRYTATWLITVDFALKCIFEQLLK